MSINRKVFFDHIRKTVFKRGLAQSAVDTLNAILDEWERRGLTDIRQLSYIMATPRGECGPSLKCVREIGRGRGKRYGRKDPKTGQVYYGRCLVQLTWDYNYKKMGNLLNLPLYENPDLALQLPNAVQIMFEGMIRGSFTGKKLGDYFTASKTDWTNARRIINGLDKALTFANWARQFHEALSAAYVAAPAPPPPKPKVVIKPVADTGAAAGGAAAGAAVAASGFDPWLAVLVGVIVFVAAFVVIRAIKH